MLTRPADQIPDDQEVGHEAQLPDDFFLVLEALPCCAVIAGVAPGQGFFQQAVEEVIGLLSILGHEFGHMIGAELEIKVDLFGHIHAGFDRVR